MDTVVILIVGTAGSGKTTLVHRLSLELAMRGDSTYILNLDPAVMHLPYAPNIDIRDTVNYKELMKQYNLGPNGAIVTALNLFATRFDKVSELLQARAKATRFILVDTPGQIEVFTWSASGNLITDMLVSSFPTVLLYAVDTPRCKSPVTFMSNMLYSCSILYKSRLPFVVAFNKVDVQPHAFAVEWMEHFDTFQTALDEANLHSDSYINSLTRSLSLALDEFYSSLSHVGVSSVTGEGFPSLLTAVRWLPLGCAPPCSPPAHTPPHTALPPPLFFPCFACAQISEAATTFKEEILPELQAARSVRAEKEKESKEKELEKLRKEMFGADAEFAAAAARAAAVGPGAGAGAPHSSSAGGGSS